MGHIKTDSEKLGQEPAFSCVTGDKSNGYLQEGMSKRFYAACAAMQGILSGHYIINIVNSPTNDINDGFPDPISICTQAFQFADELLKQENDKT